MVFQSGALFDSLTVGGGNILFSLELREDYDEKNKEDVVRRSSCTWWILPTT